MTFLHPFVAVFAGQRAKRTQINSSIKSKCPKLLLLHKYLLASGSFSSKGNSVVAIFARNYHNFEAKRDENRAQLIAFWMFVCACKWDFVGHGRQIRKTSSIPLLTFLPMNGIAPCSSIWTGASQKLHDESWAKHLRSKSDLV
jgi:hypothetical protein